jgi:hypothetical protein
MGVRADDLVQSLWLSRFYELTRGGRERREGGRKGRWDEGEGRGVKLEGLNGWVRGMDERRGVLMGGGG